MPFQDLVSKHAGRAYLHQVAAEFVLKDAFLVSAEIYVIMCGKDIEVPAPGVVPVEPDAAVALYAAVHLMVDERAEILVPVCAFVMTVPAVHVPGHHRHVLQVALAAFVAYRAIVRVVQHHPFDDTRTEGPHFRVVYRDACSICSRGHTGHHDLSTAVVFIPELLHCTLSACAHRLHRRVPAEIRDIKPQRQAGMQQVISVLYFVGLVIYKNYRHYQYSQILQPSVGRADLSDFARISSLVLSEMKRPQR